MQEALGEFQAKGATVAVIVKDDAEKVGSYWEENRITFTGIPDPAGRLGNLYKQQSKFGLMPAVFVIDKSGNLAFTHYGTGMKDIPTSKSLLGVINNLP